MIDEPIPKAKGFSIRERHAGLSVSRSDDSTVFSLRSFRDASYSVAQLTRHVFDGDEPTLTAIVGNRPVLIVMDEALGSTYGAGLRSYALCHLNTAAILTIKGGEQNKSWDQIATICESAIRSHLPRNAVMIGVGGGVALDIVGMAAALFRRGVPYVRIPTTLLGMIDVSVGVKHAFNFADKKNILGLFYPPLIAINDATFLRTVSRRDLACGIAEAIKIALVADIDLLQLIESHSETLLRTHFQEPEFIAREILERSQLAMMNELAPNLFESDLKRAVDFGHSISPTLECRSNYTIPHGEAVAIDMLISTAIAIRRGICDESLFRRLVRIYSVAGLPLISDLCTLDLLTGAMHDARCHRGGELNFVVPDGMGGCDFLQHVVPDELEAALDRVGEAADILPLSG